jgi:hypothetical protein
LYVSSKRTSIVTGRVSVETIGAAHTTSEYTEKSSLAKLQQEDGWAKDLLRKSGLKFDLVDLSNGIWNQTRSTVEGKEADTYTHRPEQPFKIVNWRKGDFKIHQLEPNC